MNHKPKTRGYAWGRRLIRRTIIAATLALTSALLLAAEAGAKYIWPPTP